jgi:hypothetical protein
MEKKIMDRIKQEQPRVVISPNPIKIKIRVDQFGNQIDPQTKQIIKKAEDQ